MKPRILNALPRNDAIMRISVLSPIILLSVVLSLTTLSHAGSSLAPGDDDISNTIRINTDGRRYSLTANQAALSDVLHELGKAAGFKVKPLGSIDRSPQDWSLDTMPLPRLLDHLLRGYSTVMLYGASKDHTEESDDQVLKEVWLLAEEEDRDPVHDSLVNIAIKLETTEVTASEAPTLTPEQAYEISYIENLEGMTGDDVIDILQQTLLMEDDPLVRKRAVTALGDIGGTRVLDALESGMGDSSAEVRSELAKSLSGIQDQRSMLLLGQLLMGDRIPVVRRQAVLALSSQKTIAARTFIEAGLQDEDDGVKKAADAVLKQWQPSPEN
jgi:HEAT repeat protein